MALFNILGLAAVAFPLYLIIATIYRLTLHPLARYPGPLLRAISGWPDGLAGKSGKRYLKHHQLHLKYGRVVRVSPNCLSFDTSQAFHDVHTDRHANVDKSGFVSFTRAVNDSLHLQQLPTTAEHTQRRKIMSHAFTDSALRSAEDFMLKSMRNWTAALAQGCEGSADGWSASKDMGHWTNLMTLDIFGELCFGKDFEATTAGDHELVHDIIKGSELAQTFAYLPIRFLLEPILRTQSLLKILSRKAYEARWALRKKLTGLIKSRHEAELEAEGKDGVDRKDFFHYVLKATDDDSNKLPLNTYISEAVLLIVAGTDTTSTALSATLFYLLNNPDKLQRLRTEVTNAFSSIEEIHTGPTLSGLTYLRACIEESMRMSPPVPGPLTRRARQGGLIVDGHHIPQNIEVEVPIYSVFRNADIYPDSYTYLPERWIAGSKTPHFEVTEELVNKQRQAFVPFSTGPRNCLGMRMAYMEMGIILARMAYLYEMRFDAKKRSTAKEFELLDWFICGKEGPWLQFKPRAGVEKA